MAEFSTPGSPDDHFLFINHDHRLISSKSQGRVIRSHVQKGRHGRRGRGSAASHPGVRPKSRMTEGTFPMDVVHENSGIFSDHSSLSSQGGFQDPLISPPQNPSPAPDPVYSRPVAETLTSSGASEKFAEDDIQTPSERYGTFHESEVVRRVRFQSHRHLPNPISILQKGNSDAFNALAIKIDPVDNQMLHFGVEVILPARFPPEMRSKLPQQAFDGVLARGIEALRNPSQGYAWLSIFTMYFSLFTKDAMLATRALRYKNQSSEILRRQMQDDDAGMRKGMVLLYTADIAARDMSAAGVHARVLGRLFEAVGSFEKLNIKLLERALLIDASHSIILMSRSPFAFQNWKLPSLFTQWGDFIGDAPNCMPPAPPSFNSCLKDGALLKILEALNEAVEFDQMLTSLDRLVESEVFPSMQCHRLICQARLTNYYLDMLEGASTFMDASLQASTAIATLFWSRIYFNDICNVRTTGFSLLDIQKAITRCETESAPTVSAPEQWLWVLYVGAEAEQLMATLNEDTWHTNRFAAQARSMGLRSWSQIREVLQGFFYSDKIKPNGSDWWWKVAYN